MQINGEKVYLFNPWQIKRWTEDEIQTKVNELIKAYNPEIDTPYGISLNIETIANIQYLYGEMIARLTEEVSDLKLKTDSKEAKEIVRTRKNWDKDNPGEKKPAMSFFEAEASEIVQDERAKQYEKEGILKRFKYAYDSFESKANALKKRLEAIRIEEF